VRTVLTFIAVALVAVMSAALIAPMLIDWSAHRAEIEARLGAITGADVLLEGPIEVRLLPTPYLALGAGSLSAPGLQGAHLSFDSARLELALVKLASGEIRFSDISLDKPVVTLARAGDGAPQLPVLPLARLQSTGVDRLIVRDGRVRVLGGANRAASEIAGLQLDAAAPSFDGPVHVEGQFSSADGAPVVFRLASQKSGPDGTPLRVEVDAGPGWPAGAFEGALTGDAAGGLAGLRFEGAATLTGTAPGESGPTPWRVAGPTTVDLDRAVLRGAEFELGPEERAIRANGDATLAFGSPIRLSVALKAKQANVDALMRRNGEDGVAPGRAAALIARIASSALESRQGRMAIDAEVAATPIILGAQTLPDASVTLRAAPGAPLHLRFSLGLPGQSRLGGEGDLDAVGAAKFRGEIDFQSADLELIRDWASLGAPPEAAAKIASVAEALPYRSASLAGAVEASASGLSGRNLKLTLDRTTLAGSLAFKAPAGAAAARLDLDLATDSLDVDALPSLAAAKAFADMDFSFSLSAGSLHIARVGEAQIDSGSVALKAVKTGLDVTLERLSVAGLGGASLDMRGAIGRGSLTAAGRLRADRLRDFAVLVSRLAPGAWSRMLVDRADELSPAALTFDARGEAGASDAPRVDSVRANGSVGETQFTIALDPRPKDAGSTLTLGLDSPNSGALLRQLGLRAAPAGSGRAHVVVNAAGDWAQGYDVDAAASLAGSDLSWRGRLLPAAEGDDAKLFGAAMIKAANLAPLAAALGLAPAGGGALGPADIGFDATLRGEKWTLSKIAATIAGVKAGGNMTYAPVAPPAPVAEAGAAVSRAEEALGAGAAAAGTPPPATEIEGELAVDRLPLAGILALALGPPEPGRPGSRWSEAKFAPAPLRPPSSAVKLKVGALDLTNALSAQGLAANLRLDKGRLDLDDLKMQVAGGGASGYATLRRDGDTATLTGSLALDSVAVERPGFSGRLGGALDFASTGRSPAALIAGLAGAGKVDFAGATLARSDPAALDRVVARAQAPDAALDETNIAFAFGAELNRAPLLIPDGSAPVALSAGVMKVGPVAIPGRRGDGALSADLDLGKLAAGARLTLTSPASGLKFWSGPPPSATVTVDSVLDAPRRQVDVSSLSAALAAQAIARETDRIATLEADIRERAFFNRRLKGERFMDRRRQEIEDFEVEQARLKGLTEHLRAEEEAEKAAAEKAAAEKAAVEKAAAEKAAADNAEAAKAETPDGGATAAKGAFAPAPAAKTDELGANAPAAAPPMPPTRPKARSTPGEPAPGGLY